MRRRRKRQAYRPSDNVVSPVSVISSGIGVTGILLYIFIIWLSVKQQGEIGVGFGLIPWVILIASIVGEWFAVQTLKDTVNVLKWKVLGAVTNGALILFTIVVFFRGLF